MELSQIHPELIKKDHSRRLKKELEEVQELTAFTKLYKLDYGQNFKKPTYFDNQ